jgi:hypothetical protein
MSIFLQVKINQVMRLQVLEHGVVMNNPDITLSSDTYPFINFTVTCYVFKLHTWETGEVAPNDIKFSVLSFYWPVEY